MEKPKDFDIDRIIQYLQGTCNTLDEGIETCYPGMTQEDLEQSDFDAIDNEIFLCETCGWWCETTERADETDEDICSDCHEDE